MSRRITFTVQCQNDGYCEGTAKHVLLDLSSGETDPVEIDLDFHCSQIVLTCDECGLNHYTGDIEIMTEDAS
jgi:hypothetical protein